MKHIRKECPCCGETFNFTTKNSVSKDIEYLKIINSNVSFLNKCDRCGFVLLFDDELNKNSQAVREFISSNQYHEYLIEESPHLSWFLLSQIAYNVYHDYRLAGFAALKYYDLIMHEHNEHKNRYLDIAIDAFWHSFADTRQFFDLLMLTDCLRRRKHWQAAFQDTTAMQKCFEGDIVNQWFQFERELIAAKDSKRKTITFDFSASLIKKYKNK